jgi:hypothetical protein
LLDYVARKRAEVDGEVAELERELRRMETDERAYYDEGIRVIELAQRIYGVWLVQDSPKKRADLDHIVLKCTWDGVSLVPK